MPDATETGALVPYIAASSQLTEATSPMTARQTLDLLIQYAGGFMSYELGEQCLYVPLQHLDRERELFKAVRELTPSFKQLFGEGEHSSVRTGGDGDKAICIPVRYLDYLNEEDSRRVLELLQPVVEKNRVIGEKLKAMQDLVGPIFIVSRANMDETRTNHGGDTPVFQIKQRTFEKGALPSGENNDYKEAVRWRHTHYRRSMEKLPETLNKAAHQPGLFSGSWNAKAYLLMYMKESDVDALLESPHVEDIRGIFYNPLGKPGLKPSNGNYAAAIGTKNSGEPQQIGYKAAEPPHPADDREVSTRYQDKYLGSYGGAESGIIPPP